MGGGLRFLGEEKDLTRVFFSFFCMQKMMMNEWPLFLSPSLSQIHMYT
jgi:hypothetical protein